MANSYFRFKQFIIHQDACAMKVCTDACILGAWFAQKIPSYSLVLDVGSGTGLLMHMLAQKSNAEIHGIEIDFDAYKQSKENIQTNKFNDRLKVFPGDIRGHSFPDRYDFIISNPPFFENDLQSSTHKKNIAKHSSELNFEDLLKAIDLNLKPTGEFGVLLPHDRAERFEDLARQNNFFLQEKLSVRQTPEHNYFRAILHFSKNKNEVSDQYELTIINEKGDYSTEFTELMRDYYLNI
jgi:tRNA1Val (adenine37-N6)-methyltransferase